MHAGQSVMEREAEVIGRLYAKQGMDILSNPYDSAGQPKEYAAYRSAFLAQRAQTDEQGDEFTRAADRLLSLPATVRRDTLAIALRAQHRNSERYRFLRARDLDTIDKGGVFAGMTPQNLVLNGEELDAAIDAAMAE